MRPCMRGWENWSPNLVNGTTRIGRASCYLFEMGRVGARLAAETVSGSQRCGQHQAALSVRDVHQKGKGIAHQIWSTLPNFTCVCEKDNK